MSNEPGCKFCGRCCFYRIKGGLKRCRFLVVLGKNKTLCRVYNDKMRHKRVIGKDVNGDPVLCVDREKAPYNYKGCPYNKEGQEDFNDGI